MVHHDTIKKCGDSDLPRWVERLERSDLRRERGSQRRFERGYKCWEWGREG